MSDREAMPSVEPWSACDLCPDVGYCEVEKPMCEEPLRSDPEEDPTFP